jgi:hypothetical protein
MAGQRLFGQTSGPKQFRLVSATTIGAGLAYVIYQAVRTE